MTMRTILQRISGCCRFRFSIVQFVLRMIYFRLVHWLFPNRRPQSPCKTFRKKNSLACYKLRFNQKRIGFDHYELFRITNPKAGEYYVLPIEALQKKVNRHISYHRSGAFHRREESGERVIPRDGEADQRRAELLNQATWHLSHQLDGYCLAVGPRVSKDALETMIEILDGYILPPLKLVVNIQTLLDRKNLTIPMLETPQKRKAYNVVAKAIENEEVTTLSSEEIEASIRKALGDQSKITTLEPKSGKYFTFSKEVTMKLIDIARELSLEKMEGKPSAFWTDTQSTCSKKSNS